MLGVLLMILLDVNWKNKPCRYHCYQSTQTQHGTKMEMMLANNGNNKQFYYWLQWFTIHVHMVASKIQLIITVLDLLQLQQTFNF